MAQIEALSAEILHKKKGMRISLIIHGIILLLALIPFFQPDPEKNIDTQYAVQIAFDQKDIVFENSKSSASTKSSSASGASRPKTEVAKPAEKPAERPKVKPAEVIKVTTPKPTVQETKPAPKPAPEVKTPTPTPQPSEPVEAEIVTEEAEVIAVEEEIQIDQPEPEIYEAPAPVDIPTSTPEASTSSLPSLEDILATIESEVGDILDGIPTENAEPSEEDGGGGLPSGKDEADNGSGTGDEGEGKGDGDSGDDNDDGIGMGGTGDGEYDDSGDGVFGRKVLYRDPSMIKNASSKSGILVFKVCIGRAGTVTYAEINEFESTIKDRKIRKAALRSINKYKYEPDPSAPKEQCGKYKFTSKNDNGFN